MITNKIKYSLLFLLIGIIGFFLYETMYVEFEPIVFADSSYKTVEVDSTFNRNLEVVLGYYKVDYKINKEGKVVIKRNLVKDKELRWNYTVKALDTAWIRSYTNE